MYFRGKLLHDGITEPKANRFNSGIGCLICFIFYKRAGLYFLSLFPEFLGSGAHFLFRNIETPFEKYRWRGEAQRSIDDEIAYHGKSSLKIQLNTTEYSGVGLKYFPRDWQNYKALIISVYNPVLKPIKLTCRVHDRQHTEGPQLYGDRFNKSYVLDKDWNTIKISLEEIANAPRTRQMNIRQIYGLGIFAVRLPEPRIIFIDNVRLIR